MAKTRRGKRRPTRAKRRPPAARKPKKAAKKPAPHQRDGGLLTRRELAVALSNGRAQALHPQTVTKWEQEGMPVAERGGKGRPSFYQELEVRAWLQQRDEAAKSPGTVNLVADRARRERAQAALAEQAYAIRMHDLRPAADMEKAWAEEIGAVRTRLLAMPVTLADRLFRAATTHGLAGVERELEEGVFQVLRELEDPNRALPSGPERTPEAGQAA